MYICIYVYCVCDVVGGGMIYIYRWVRGGVFVLEFCELGLGLGLGLSDMQKISYEIGRDTYHTIPYRR